MKYALLSALLFLYSCSNQPATTAKQEPEKIRTITFNNAGGQLGFSSHLVFTPDSVFYLRHIHMTPESNDSFRRANTSEAWQALTGDLQLDSFRNAVDGPSVQPVDGIDTEISILTTRDTITKTNARESGEWMRLQVKAEAYLETIQQETSQ